MSKLRKGLGIKVFATFFSFLILSSCVDDTVSQKTNTFLLPTLKNTEPVADSVIGQILDKESFFGRSTTSMNTEAAVSAVYEGYEDFNFVYVPDLHNANRFYLYTFHEGELTNGVATLINNESSLVYYTTTGAVEYQFEDNFLVGMNVSNNDVSITGKSASEEEPCSLNKLGEGFLDCGDALEDQLSDAVGEIGAVIALGACSLWVVCRGSVAVVCTTLAVANC